MTKVKLNNDTHNVVIADIQKVFERLTKPKTKCLNCKIKVKK